MEKNEIVFYPQDEMNTVLIPVTTGCSYNRCAFCSMYKDNEYKEVPITEIENHLINAYIYTERVFLTGADPLSIGFRKMKIILEMIRKRIPYCACVASYASVKNISMYTLEELTELHDLGLRMLYIGFETGSDKVLKLMNKGHTVEEAVREARKLNQAKLQFNSILMYGIAGEGEGIQNARLTAQMLNKFVTARVIMMNLTVFHGTELEEMILRGEFRAPGRVERLSELREIVTNLEPEYPAIFDTTHPTNIIKIKGTLPQDREKLISEIAAHIQ